MIPDIGFSCLIMALAIASLQCLWPSIYKLYPALPRFSPVRTAACAQFICICIAFAALIISHVDSDFTVLNVAVNSHRDMPLFYKITGVWGNHEGSMLLWLWVLGLYG